MVSFAFVISVSRLRGTEAQVKRARTYNGSIGACAVFFLLVGVVVLATAAKYQVLSREDTLIRPAFVTNTNGVRVVEYNPRISLVLRKLDAGNIYDRNEVLLATSDRECLRNDSTIAANLKDAGVTANMLKAQTGKHKRRYYPFGDHMLFMLGDYNTLKVYDYYDSNPIGYLAEKRHLGTLRGFDIKPGETYKPKKGAKIEIRDNRFSEKRPVDSPELHTLDYSPLLGFLKEGIECNDAIKKHNAKREQRDLTLTVDAHLQMALQNALAKEFDRENKESKLHGFGLWKLKDLRASVVVIDATRGDVLCSANYPLPNQDVITQLEEIQIKEGRADVPSERYHVEAQTQYQATERDLGLSFQTAPGSTAKVMTAMAGLRKMHDKAFNQGFEIKPFMNIEKPNAEPHTTNSEKNRKGGRKTYMDDAIKWSSNCYFIMSLNENDLYDQLGEVYWQVGAKLSGKKSTPFGIPGAENSPGRIAFDKKMDEFRVNGLSDYQAYMSDPKRGGLPESTQWDVKSPARMNSIQNYTGIAWGQSQLEASPLNMARVAGIVGNKGVLAPVRFLMEKDDKQDVRILEKGDSDLLDKAMRGEASKHNFSYEMGGKTGTPNRTRYKQEGNINDAWYIFYVHSPKLGHPIAVAIRLERTKGTNSVVAFNLAKHLVLPQLKAYLAPESKKK